jgi:hypothetical protein
MDLLPNGVLYRGAMTGREGRAMRHGSGELLEDICASLSLVSWN